MVVPCVSCTSVTGYFAPQEMWHPHTIFPRKIGTPSGNLTPPQAYYPRISCTPLPIILGYCSPLPIIVGYHAPPCLLSWDMHPLPIILGYHTPTAYYPGISYTFCTFSCTHCLLSWDIIHVLHIFLEYHASLPNPIITLNFK